MIVQRDVFPKAQGPNSSIELKDKLMRLVLLLMDAAEVVDTVAVVVEESGAEALAMVAEVEIKVSKLKPLWNLISGSNLLQRYKPL